jgi:hypothetical protein
MFTASEGGSSMGSVIDVLWAIVIGGLVLSFFLKFQPHRRHALWVNLPPHDMLILAGMAAKKRMSQSDYASQILAKYLEERASDGIQPKSEGKRGRRR